MGVATGCGCKEAYRFPHTTYPYSSCICSFLQQHPYFLFIINPRRACAARVTVIVLCVCMCVCMYVCMYVCMCVCPLIPAASHIGITKERYQRILRNTGIVLNFSDFFKNASFKSYGVICLPRAAPVS